MGNSLRRTWNGLRHALAWLPLLGLGLLVAAAAQDWSLEPLLWREGWGVLIVLALAGALAARAIAAALRETRLTSIVGAGPGYVAIKGKARFLPDHPLEGPASRKPCVWYRHFYTDNHRRRCAETTRPFLLEDGSGKCLVLPAGADIDPPAGDGGERLIEPGTELYVLGEYRSAASTPMQFDDPNAVPGPLSLQLGDATAAQIEAAHRQLEEMRRELQRPVKLPRLPCIVLPEDGRPFRIGSQPKEQDASWYRLLLALDLLVLAAGALVFPFTKFLVLFQ